MSEFPSLADIIEKHGDTWSAPVTSSRLGLARKFWRLLNDLWAVVGDA